MTNNWLGGRTEIPSRSELVRVPARGRFSARVLRSVLFLASLVGSAVLAQDLTYTGLMPTLDHGARITDRFGYSLYAFDATKLGGTTPGLEPDKPRSFMVSAELGITYRLNDRFTVTLAYLHQWLEPSVTFSRSEDRGYQQLAHTLPLGRSELRQRLRYEERSVRTVETGTITSSQRLRYRIGVKRLVAPEHWYVLAQTELFLNTMEGLAFRMDENWTTVQLGYAFSKANAVEVGPLYVGWYRNEQKDILHQFYLQLTWVTRIDLRRRQAASVPTTPQ